MLMDFHCIETWLGLPEFRVIDQVLGPQQLEVHLERRDDHHRVSPMSDMQLPGEGEPTAVYP